MTDVVACGPSDEGLDDLIRELFDEPLSLGEKDAWQSFFFTLNPSNNEHSQSGRWRRGANSKQVATVRLFGWVHHESMIGPYGSMERGHVQWFRPLNMAKKQKQILVLHLPPGISSQSLAAKFMKIQGRNLYYILRERTGQPDLDQVMEDESRERPPKNRTNAWITSTQGGTFISLTSKLWQDNDANSNKMGGSLPRNLYSMPSQSAVSTPPPAQPTNDYTMATWPNPRNLEYSQQPEATKYRLASLDAFDEDDTPIPRVKFPTVLRPGTAVVVDVTMALWRICDPPKEGNPKPPPTWTDTFQLIMQQIKVVKSAPDPYPGAVYMEDLGPEIQPSPTSGLKRRAATPPLELSPPTKKPLPSTPSKKKSTTVTAWSPSPPNFSNAGAGPSTYTRSVRRPPTITQPATPPPSTQADPSQEKEYVLAYDSDEDMDQIMEDSSSSKPKSKAKGKGKGKGRAK
ncbi:hypothetical protein FRC01_013913 [Tulasnella sp. 417]|nr:hypothetical protein FRC01_013913 [Tulasnella sp. 417]